MRDIRGSEEMLDHAADRRRVDAHPALFLHNIALLVELTLDGMANALALQISPEFEAVRGHAPEVLRRVFCGGGVDADGAVLLGDGGELVWDDELLSCGFSILKDFQQLSELLWALADTLAILRIVSSVGNLDLGESNFFRRIVCCANLG